MESQFNREATQIHLVRIFDGEEDARDFTSAAALLYFEILTRSRVFTSADVARELTLQPHAASPTNNG